MISLSDIRKVHIELSSKCNASCSLCPRNFYGYPYNNGYPETNMTLEQVKHILPHDFLSQLTGLWINGNYGDMVMNPESADIVEYFREANPNISIGISTNGSARRPEFWKRLAKAGAWVCFCLDGLADTHHLYRQNTNWSAIIKNATTFIEAGGKAIWKFIEFDHNVHQIDQCRKLAHDMGFVEFRLVNENRNIGPVFDRHGKLVTVIGKYQGPTEFPVLFHKKETTVLLEDVIEGKRPKTTTRCKAKLKNEIYIAANGDVSPCCWTGFHPKTYGRGGYHEPVNAQLAPLIKNSNALENSLEECILWFKTVEDSWKHREYEHGRLIVCDDNCGA